MANFLYATFKKSLLDGSNNLGSVTIKAALVTASYSPNTVTDQFWSTAAANVIGTPVALASVTTTGGVLKSANVSYTMPGSTTAKYIVLYIDTGTAGTSQLICVDDTAASSGLPYTNGSSSATITLTPDSTNGWFQL